MTPSIARRIRATIVAITLASLAAMLALGWQVQEEMEYAILDDDQRASRDLILAIAPRDQPLLWDTPDLLAYYEPAAMTGQQPLPELFRDLPFPVSQELELPDRTYLITASDVGHGRLYLARNISNFEQRVGQARSWFLLVSAAILLLALLLAQLASHRLIRPLRQLTAHIEGLQPQRQMARAPTDQRDLELRTIAESFNRFLEAQEAFVRREQSLVSLTSHELRTPTAIISGALDVVQQRGRLSAEDGRTLERARRATDELRHTIELILKLGRAGPTEATPTTIHLVAMIRETLDDLRLAGHDSTRCEVACPPGLCLQADAMLVKMLIRNLVHNALRHTSGLVRISAAEGWLRVADDGPGLPEAYRHLLRQDRPPGPLPAAPALSGLGLVIVTLIGDRLGWRIVMNEAGGPGTVLEAHWPPADQLPATDSRCTTRPGN